MYKDIIKILNDRITNYSEDTIKDIAEDIENTFKQRLIIIDDYMRDKSIESKGMSHWYLSNIEVNGILNKW